jgi:hypothetical protein
MDEDARREKEGGMGREGGRKEEGRGVGRREAGRGQGAGGAAADWSPDAVNFFSLSTCCVCVCVFVCVCACVRVFACRFCKKMKKIREVCVCRCV